MPPCDGTVMDCMTRLVDQLGVRIAVARDVGCQRVLHVADAIDHLPNVREMKIQMLTADEIDVIVFAAPDRLKHLGCEEHQAPRLSVALVFLEESDDPLHGRMEGWWA